MFSKSYLLPSFLLSLKSLLKTPYLNPKLQLLLHTDDFKAKIQTPFLNSKSLHLINIFNNFPPGNLLIMLSITCVKWNWSF